MPQQGATSLSGRSLSAMTALIIREVLAKPGHYRSARALALEIGEEPRRVYRAMQEIGKAGWTQDNEAGLKLRL